MFAVLLAVGVLEGENAAAVAIAAAPLLSLIVLPWALGRQVAGVAADRRPDPAPTEAGVHAWRTGWASPARCS